MNSTLTEFSTGISTDKLSGLASLYRSPISLPLPELTLSPTPESAQGSVVVSPLFSSSPGPSQSLSPLPLLMVSETDTPPSSIASFDSVPELVTPPPSSSPIYSSDEEDNFYPYTYPDQDRLSSPVFGFITPYREPLSSPSSEFDMSVYATWDVVALNKLLIVSSSILMPPVIAAAAEAIRNHCDLKDINFNANVVKNVLTCWKRQNVKDWIRKNRIVLTSLSLEIFIERLSEMFLPVNWELDIIWAHNNCRQGNDSFKTYCSFPTNSSSQVMLASELNSKRRDSHSGFRALNWQL
ncbi:hypothetical protein C8J56DRAFT_1048280 [Mycena floridula]|nr:hypothetical protein C8J56DRAFT_1048280 [Mycena floridula]